MPLAISIEVGLIICFGVPKPTEVSKQAWQLFMIFLTTIVGLIMTPLPIGAWAFVCLMISVITKTITIKNALSTFTKGVIWLIVVSFLFRRRFMKTGLGYCLVSNPRDDYARKLGTYPIQFNCIYVDWYR
ncbi:putative solute carrier family 13 [Helianthus annuus]|nr:putative solute carrier family 13 [Helianthus annuus]KAJ0632532.1 putative solute carrier family 13 [Helianthus annuus]KAJ0636378.1 putative solute carrier family 13 [Helianthus annuus]KAJ0667461.1 putative solute carrier family 13 [Helianthus annuus]